jgi:hypothetical protein
MSDKQILIDFCDEQILREGPESLIRKFGSFENEFDAVRVAHMLLRNCIDACFNALEYAVNI